MTREELIKSCGQSGHVDENFKQHDFFKIEKSKFKDILSAETEEQQKCEYCHGGRNAKPIIDNSSNFLAFDKNGIVVFGNDGSVTTGEDYERFMFCPMCGRKLGDE